MSLIKKHAVRLLLGAVLLAATAYLAIGFYIYSTLTNSDPGCGLDCANTPNNFTDNWAPSDFAFDQYQVNYWENHRYAGGDIGITLDAWWLPVTSAGAGNAPVVIGLHGIRSNKYDQDMLTVAGMLHQKGFNVLLFDQRDHGDSSVEDGRVSLGTREYRDVIASVDWLINEQNIAAERIGLYGESMGASTAAIAFGMDKRIQSVVLDNGYLDLQVLIHEELQYQGFPTWLAPGAIWAGTLFVGESLLDPAPSIAFINHHNRPMFAMHGTADTRVLPHHTADMATLGQQQGANLSTWFAEDAVHSGVKYLYPEEFSSRVSTFFANSLSGKLIPNKE